MLSQGAIIFPAYLAAGRAGVVATCLYLGISPWETLIIAVLIDMFQIPIYGLALETSKKHVILPERFQNWVALKSKKLQKKIREKKYWQKILHFQNIAIIIVTTIPFRGFGVLSASILAVILGYNRVTGTILILTGSIIGSVLSILAIYFPGKYFGLL